MTMLSRRPLRWWLLAALFVLGVPVQQAGAQWVQAHEQFYLEASHNWRFRRHYPGADRLFNAFDYGHAVLYETLWRHPTASPARLEEDEYAFITRHLLNRPPSLPLEEAAIEPMYARLVPEAKLMFEWAHILHRQLYDVLADERLSSAARDAEVARLVAYYKSRPDLAFSTRPKNMELMEGQRYSLAFRKTYPKFNGLIWAYHWLQVGLYEPLLTGATEDEQQTGVAAAVARFRQMLESPPTRMPRVMPMTAAVAPTFARRYPQAAVIFDNLHGMHDVISDVLASPVVSRDRKRAEILLAARRYRDDTSFVMTEQEWREMAIAMGVENQGGVAASLMTPAPEGTAERGAAAGHAGHAQRAPGDLATDSTRARAQPHRYDPSPARTAAAHAHEVRDSTDGPSIHATLRVFERLLSDPVIRQRIANDVAMRRALLEVVDSLPAEHREHMRQLIPRPATRPAPNRRTQPTARRTTPPAKRPAAKAAGKPVAKPAPKPADPHAGHKP